MSCVRANIKEEKASIIVDKQDCDANESCTSVSWWCAAAFAVSTLKLFYSNFQNTQTMLDSESKVKSLKRKCVSKGLFWACVFEPLASRVVLFKSTNY